MVKQLWHVFSGIKAFLIVTTGAIVGNSVITQNYDLQTASYLGIGLVGFIFFSIIEEWVKKNGR